MATPDSTQTSLVVAALADVTKKGVSMADADRRELSRALNRARSDLNSGERELPQTQVRAEFLIESLGSGAAVARLLGVSRGQPARWSTGDEMPAPETARLLVDVDHVLARARLLWTREVALEWLTGQNSHLDGARPVDVLRDRGPAEVLTALDATWT